MFLATLGAEDTQIAPSPKCKILSRPQSTPTLSVPLYPHGVLNDQEPLFFRQLDDRMTRYSPLFPKHFANPATRPRQRELLIEFLREGEVDEAVRVSRSLIWRLFTGSLTILSPSSLPISPSSVFHSSIVRIWFFRSVRSLRGVPFRELSRVTRGEIRILIGMNLSEILEVFEVYCTLQVALIELKAISSTRRIGGAESRRPKR